MIILMLCNKIEINKSECFMQTIEAKINQSALCKQGCAFIYLCYFQRVTFRKKHSDNSVQKVIKFYKFHVFLAQENSSVYTKFCKTFNKTC